MILPGVGVSAKELATVTLGSSAGPSKLLFAQAVENENPRNEIVIVKSEASHCMRRLLFCLRV
jgi:hypothetical protein